MPDISFLSQGIPFTLKEKKKTGDWLTSIAKKEGRKIESLSYVFASDNFVADLNKKYLGHNAFTDIITFDYSDAKAVIGEVYISVPRVKDNARTFGQAFPDELRRVIVHGLLHLIGYGDKTSRQSTLMRRKEDACLSLWSRSST